jgi:hypothetical protein
MSFYQNLDYALVQVVHNFGAAAVVGGSLAAFKFCGMGARKELARVVLAGWVTQAVSGAGLGAVSYYYYHQFPDITGIALFALAIKMCCAAIGFVLMATYLLRSENWPVARIDKVWIVSALLSIAAMSAAAFLRWFS